MAEAKLPDLPAGKEYEEYVAAYLQAAGMYTERNVAKPETLELDIIATHYEAAKGPVNQVIEVKGGGWGAGDLFKIKGWLEYLKLRHGGLVARQTPTQIVTLRGLAQELGLTLMCVPEGAPMAEVLAEVTGNPVVDERDIVLWRFVFWTERRLLERLTTKKKSAPQKKAYKALDDYVNLVNNKVFLTANVVRRAVELSRAFKDNSRISAKLAHEMNGADFDGEHTKIPIELFRESYRDCKLNDLAVSTYIENRARLAGLKAATDYLLLKREGDDHNESYTVKIEEFEIEYGGNLLDLVPESYRVGLEAIADAPFLHRYPIFWQWFLWCFGGFLVVDRMEQEFELLAAKTGIPKEHIPDALKVFDLLFPIEGGGWFKDYYGIRLMQLASVPFMGIGANLRRRYYAEDQKFQGLKVTEPEGKSKLLQWNNCVVALLT